MRASFPSLGLGTRHHLNFNGGDEEACGATTLMIQSHIPSDHRRRSSGDGKVQSDHIPLNLSCRRSQTLLIFRIKRATHESREAPLNVTSLLLTSTSRRVCTPVQNASISECEQEQGEEQK